MPTIKQLNQTVAETKEMQAVASIFTEAAASKLQKIRAGIIRNRDFFAELLAIFRIVKLSALRKHIKPIIKPKERALLLLTSNQRFYGTLETKLIHYFLENITKTSGDIYAVGKVGQNYLQAVHFPHPFASCLFERDVPIASELTTLMQTLNPYQQVLVFYSRLKSIAVQEPAVLDVAVNIPKDYVLTKEQMIHYIFEPEIAEILAFFESQIITLTLEQTFMESELARTAARLLTMDQAKANAEELLSEQRRLLFDVKRSLANAQLLETIGSLMKTREAIYEKG